MYIQRWPPAEAGLLVMVGAGYTSYTVRNMQLGPRIMSIGNDDMMRAVICMLRSVFHVYPAPTSGQSRLLVDGRPLDIHHIRCATCR